MNVRKTFDREVAEDLQRQIGRTIIGCYSAAVASAYEMFPRDARIRLTAIGYFRWFLIEAGLLKLKADAFPDITIGECSNANPRQAHVLIRSGSAIMTESRTRSIEDLPRDANFRLEHSNGQVRTLFSMDEYEEKIFPIDGCSVYGILSHRPKRRQPDWMDYLHVVFPDTKYSAIVDRIDLVGRYDLRSTVMTPEETVGDENLLKIKEQVERNIG